MSGASYEVGSAFIQMVPSFDGVVTQIAAQAADWGSQAGEAFAETFKSIVNSELKDMDAVKIDADTSEASAKAQALRAEIDTLDAMIDVGFNEGDAQEKLAALEAELAALELEHPEIRIGVDMTDAELELEGLTAETTAATVAMDGLGASGTGAGPGLSQAGGDAAEFSGEVSFLAVGLTALAVALLPIGGLALGAFAALPAILSGAVVGLGAVYGALEPIVTTLEAFSTRNAPTSSGGGSGASTAISNATAERDAAYSVQQAEEALANAQINGAQAVAAAQKSAAASAVTANQNVINSETALVNAERTVTEAVYNEQQAQEAVIAARTAAANQLQDYTDQLADNAISQQQDQLNLTEAQAAYSQATQPGSTATYDQQQQAYINLQQAQQAIKDLNDQNSQLSATASAAFAAGVDGAQGVLDAEHNLQTATQAVTDAITAQQTAQQNVATATAAAAAQIITNQQNIANAQRKNAQGVADAERSLEQALANQKSALETASVPMASASVGVRTYAQDFAKLTPEGKNFVDFVETQLLPAFRGISDIAQNGLLPGLETGLQDMLPLFKDLDTFIWGAANGIGGFVTDLGKFAGSTTGLTQIQELFANGQTFMGDLGQAADIFLQAFVGVGAQSEPIINALGTGIINIAKAFNNWVNDGGFQGFMTWLRQNGPQLVSDIGAFITGFGKLAVALTPIGVYLDDFIGLLSTLVGWVVDNWSRFSALAIAVGAVGIAILAITGGPITLLIAAATLLGAGLLILADHWSEVWTNIKNWTKDAWTAIDADFVQPWVDFFTKTVPTGFDNFVAFCKALPSRALGALGDFAKVVFGPLILTATWLEQNIGSPILNFFTSLPSEIGKAAAHMWDGIEAAFVTMLNALIDVWDSLNFKLPGFSIGPVHFGGETIGMPQIPKLPVPSYHTGGVVQGTPGIETLALLMPGELVTPAGVNFSGLTAGARGGSITNHFHGVDYNDVPFVQKVVTDAIGQFFDDIGKAA